MPATGLHLRYRRRLTAVAGAALVAAGLLLAQTGLVVARGDIPNYEATRNLFVAVEAGDFAAVQAAVAAGAEVAAQDQWGLTPIDLAVDKGYYKIAHFLLSVRNYRREQQDRKRGPKGTPAAESFASQGAATVGSAGGIQLDNPFSFGAPEPGAAAPAPAASAAGAESAHAEERMASAETGLHTASGPAGGAPDRPPDTALWPENEPNPFDPANPAFGAILPMLGEAPQR